jgi:hypothetical protein
MIEALTVGELHGLGNLPHQRQCIEDIEALVVSESDKKVIQPDGGRIMLVYQRRPLVVLLVVARVQYAGVLDPFE